VYQIYFHPIYLASREAAVDQDAKVLPATFQADRSRYFEL
jgi:hypothetical protein